MLSLNDDKNEIRRYPRKKGIGKITRKPKLQGYKPSPLIVVKRQPTEEELKQWMGTVSGFVTALTCDMEGASSEFYDYQQEHMENKFSFRSIDKARQVGFSYTFSAESLAKCHLKGIQTSIFISYNQEEANEKIRFAKALYDSMPLSYQKKLVVDNKQSLEFELNGKRSRILSFAQRQPRGKGYNTDIYLDEFAHMPHGKQIYAAALPVLSRGSGVLTLASTPLGKRNLHYEISTNISREYTMFSRMQIYWWDCPALCTDVHKARLEAPLMSTEERIEKFATSTMKVIRKASDSIENFMQEYELHYADESLSFYPLDLIQHCVYDTEEQLESNIDPEEIVSATSAIVDANGTVIEADTITKAYSANKLNWYNDNARFHGGGDIIFDLVKEMVQKLIFAMKNKGFGRNLIAGMDIGRNRDASEISIFEQIDLLTHNLHIERMGIELDNVPYKLQRKIVRYLLDVLPISKFNIDATGIGEDIAETIRGEYSGRVEGIKFTLESKSDLAKNFRFRLEDRAIALCNDPHSIRQIHSIKKTVTESSNVKYEAEKNSGKHHGDKFWSKALASLAGDSYDRNRIISTSLKYSGKRIFINDLLVAQQPNKPLVVPVTSKSIGVGLSHNNSIVFSNPMMAEFADSVLHEVS